MNIPFIKMHGLGNDYIFLDAFRPEIKRLVDAIDIHRLAQHMSDRHTGIGSDGLVLIMPSKEADAMMRIFNADGSEAQMCGNAIRCVGKYLYESGRCPAPQMIIETLSGMHTLTIDRVENGMAQLITVNMGIPLAKPDAISLGADPRGFVSVNIGNPHAVFFRDAVISLDELGPLGAKIGTHPHFPEGTNVEFVRVRNAHEIDVRVWERGTGVTLACGTGSCAAVVAAILQQWTSPTVTVHLPGGDLFVRWAGKGEPVFMTGPASEIFRGEYKLD